jgi:hypothetical protein
MAEDRIPMEARFSAPVQNDPGAHLASYTISTGSGSFPGLKRPGREIHHPQYLAQRLKKEYSHTPNPLIGLRGLFYGELYFYVYLTMERVPLTANNYN